MFRSIQYILQQTDADQPIDWTRVGQLQQVDTLETAAQFQEAHEQREAEQNETLRQILEPTGPHA